MNSVLVTGAGGYIGSVLVEKLLAAGHRVKGVDRYYFGKDLLGPEILNNQNFTVEQKDIRELSPRDFEGIDVVMDLAGLSNDPTCDLRPKLTYDINFLGGKKVADCAKQAGVKRHIYSSSCSCYGAGESQQLTEESELNPVSAYAKGKVDVEKHLMSIQDDGFNITMMRNATVYGLSKRMRFDLIINVMTLFAWRDSKVFVMGGGKQWRPLVHAADVAKAFMAVMDADLEKVKGQVFNVGATDQNFQVRHVANMVKEVLPATEIVQVPDDADKRSYNVSFDKIREVLDFTCDHSAIDGIREIEQALSYGAIDPEDLKTSTIKYYKFLLEAEKTFSEMAINGRIF